MLSILLVIFLLLFGEVISSFCIHRLLLLNLLFLAPRLLLFLTIKADKDSIIDLTVIIEFILTVGLTALIVELDYILIFDRQVSYHILIETTLSNGRVERGQDVGMIADIFNFLTKVERIVASFLYLGSFLGR